jgi:hypothetical protein
LYDKESNRRSLAALSPLSLIRLKILQPLQAKPLVLFEKY